MADPDDARTLWDAALALNRAARAVRVERAGRDDAAPRPLPPLLFFTDPARTPAPWRTAACLPPGAAVVYRHFGAADADVVARRLREVTRARGVLLLIGLDAALADHVGADGVHLPEKALVQASRLRAARPDWLVTGAIHAPMAALEGTGVDAFVLSPIFQAGGASASKPTLGIGALTEAASIGSPIYALGGITAANVGALARSGACGLAGVEAIAAAFVTPD